MGTVDSRSDGVGGERARRTLAVHAERPAYGDERAAMERKTI